MEECNDIEETGHGSLILWYIPNMVWEDYISERSAMLVYPLCLAFKQKDDAKACSAYTSKISHSEIRNNSSKSILLPPLEVLYWKHKV